MSFNQSVKLHNAVTFQMLHHVITFDEKLQNLPTLVIYEVEALTFLLLDIMKLWTSTKNIVLKYFFMYLKIRLPSICHFSQYVTYICNMVIMLHCVIIKQSYSIYLKYYSTVI